MLLVLSSCGKRYVPKPYGYFRIDLPEHQYKRVAPEGVPVSFEVAEIAQVKSGSDPQWFDIIYPPLNVTLHCSYKPVHGNLRQLGDDAQEFVFKHAGKASSIPEQGFADYDKRIFGVYYELRGNTASPQQFYLTDSTHHFLRGSVYFNCIPNQDSLAPVIDFMDIDMRHLMETTTWQ